MLLPEWRVRLASGVAERHAAERHGEQQGRRGELGLPEALVAGRLAGAPAAAVGVY